MDILDLSLLVVGNHPLLGVWHDVGDGLACIDQLTLFEGTSAELAVAWCCHYAVREVELCHLQCCCHAFDGCLCVGLACLHLMHARQCSFLLLFHGIELTLGSSIFCLILFELDRCSGIAL